MAADFLVIHGARASAAMVLTFHSIYKLISLNILSLAPEGLVLETPACVHVFPYIYMHSFLTLQQESEFFVGDLVGILTSFVHSMPYLTFCGDLGLSVFKSAVITHNPVNSYSH